MKRNIAILGSTGSIGLSSLKVLSTQYQEYGIDNVKNKLYALFANSSVDKLIEQIKTFQPKVAGLYDQQYQQAFLDKFSQLDLEIQQNTKLLFGSQQITDFIQSTEVDVIINAIVGFAGLESTLKSLLANKTLLLANKESLVVGGHLVKQILQRQPQAKLVPIDSEHNAIFQSLPESIQTNMCVCDIKQAGVEKIILTGSGGPFLNLPLEDFKNISVEQALKHPNWSMGAKVTIDSSTMMNKGLEFIEAAVLFNCNAQQIQTIIHPQSIVHSGVEYLDKSIIVQMGPTDMCVPIAYALNYPERNISSVNSLNLFTLSGLTFKEVDYQRYPNFKLAIDAFTKGFTYTASLNAANEVTVAKFLDKQINYQDIYKFNSLTLEKLEQQLTVGEVNFDIESYFGLYQLDQYARKLCRELITNAKQL